MKFLRKITHVFLITTLLIPTLMVPKEAQAKTLRDLKNELKAIEDKYNANAAQQQLTKEQMAQVQKNIENIKAEMNQINIDVEKLTNEIAELEVNIKKKDKEIKELISFVQISNGESAYLEYVFGAKSFTDFIYRMSISEQLANYNDELIDSFNKMIKDNENKKVELKNKKETLTVKQNELNTELAKLGEQLSSLADTSISIKDQIKAQKEIIQTYVDLDCGLDEDISTCGRGLLPSNTAFYRPLKQGHVTSEWGNRPLFSGFHEGIDMTVRPNTNVPVYSTGNGVVASVIHRSNCGGNMVLIHHTVGGKAYTSMYAHLRSIHVSRGQYVTTQTQIGIMGGHDDTQSYDQCTFGAHLHFTISTGLYGVDYGAWSTLISRSINPRSMVNFPSGTYNEWYDRNTAY